MRQRIGVEHLKAPITNQEVEGALAKAERAVNDLSQLPPTWLSFCNEKLSIASESIGFLIRQRVQLHKRGYPSRELDYLKLIERQIEEHKQVYLSFYRLAPGLIHQLRSQEPEIYAWLMLQKELGSELDNLLCGLSLLEELDTKTAMVIVTQSPVELMDSVISELIEGKAKSSPFYFECLRLRQTLSVALIKRWHKSEIIRPNIALPLLALQDVEEGIEWINEHANGELYLFERLITKRDRGTWFRQYFGIEPSGVPSAQVLTFAKLLELKEFEVFDISSSLAPVDFALCGDWKLVPEIIGHLQRLEEHEGEIWIQAMYVVYGKLLPLTPQDVGVEYEWRAVVDLLNEWLEDGKHIQNLPSRLGYALSFESTLAAMQDVNIDALFRDWLWRQICIQSRAYVPWDMAMPVHQQDWNFNNLKAAPSASERFKLRNSNAVMGY
ncbi:hypothetical protein ACW0FS_001299 [Vibrio vulnificus]|uniref:hypothetical protein n=1 Tax=Vibrio vulnificus TaxID=672 RepID=UPI001A185CD9|nr:hypothetical protein [Vibrio vulnificus]EHU9448992.1 hypothetical protein [Vibrio vulnificus]EJV9311798.1 hypothetical protein [Vibrio vulnificus]ELV8622875.1 hypothetical protein [Vibrio vulnificus]ELV8737912.1 hypothetical protein [Vibrio vulnificus]MCA0779849.1 hypothetical protein [Vibrio vulnificus]